NERDLFGNESDEPAPDEPPAQQSMFGGREGTEASRPLEAVERAARSELERLKLERKGMHGGGAAALRIDRRIAELEKLVNRGKAITQSELATRASAGENESLFGA